MADEVDRANDLQEIILMHNIREAIKPHAVTKSFGFCLFCRAKIDGGSYCDDDCKLDHAQELRFSARG